MNTTNTSKAYQWLITHNLVLDEGFSAALRNLSKAYQLTHGIHTLQEVYQKIGTTKEYIYTTGKNIQITLKQKNKIPRYSFCCPAFWAKLYRRRTSHQ